MNPIKQARLDLGWTQNQLAGLSGIDQPQISRLENRRESSLKYSRTIAKIEKAMGLLPRTLLET